MVSGLLAKITIPVLGMTVFWSLSSQEIANLWILVFLSSPGRSVGFFSRMCPGERGQGEEGNREGKHFCDSGCQHQKREKKKRQG